MEPTLRQRRLIRKLLAWHQRPPTWGNLFLRVILIVLCWTSVLALCVMFAGTESSLLPYCAGIITGFLAVNLAVVRLTMAGWPVYEAVIDWSKVEAIAGPAERPGV